jgi:glycosyltransferase involved in cell wall biosynthesis
MLPMPLVICGDGPDRGAVEQLIQRLGLRQWVSLVGEVAGVEAVAGHLANCTALILASTGDETWGLVVNEAMAAGCPVLVAKQCGCARDLVKQGVNGFTFDGEDSDALARHMLWIQTNQDRLEAMGKKSMEIVGRFSPAHFALNVDKLTTSARESSTRSTA